MTTSRDAALLMRLGWMSLIVGMLTACATPPAPQAPVPSRPIALEPPPPATGAVVTLDDLSGPHWIGPDHPTWQQQDASPLPASIQRQASRWQPVRWADVPGWGADNLHDLWNAWLHSCERPMQGWASICRDLRGLSIAHTEQRYAWIMEHFQAYRVTPTARQSQGLLTGYYEPIMPASRVRQGAFQHPLYAVPAGIRSGQPWFTREQMETSAQARSALQGLEIAWLADPIDALLLQIQGSGRLVVQEPNGEERTVRLAFAGHNSHPYRSVGRWLLDQGHIRSGTWEAIRDWATANPHRINEMLWSNPRMVFFREEPLDDFLAQFGPRGAQGVPLTPGRSIAVDRHSIPYGTPVWMWSPGPHAQVRRLVMAQDTGAAIVGAVRADFFTGWGDEAYTLAAGIKQPLSLWALWPKP
jgi:membrane-bound lytic murein transglycosylase A